MKIPVHEIEGQYYCSIDDVVRYKANKLEQQIYPKSEAIECFKNYRLFIHIKSMIEEVDQSLTLQHLRDKYPALFDGDVLYSQQLFRCNGLSTMLFSLKNGVYQVKDLVQESNNLSILKLSDRSDVLSQASEDFTLFTFKQTLAIEEFYLNARKSPYFSGQKENELFSSNTPIIIQATDILYLDIEDAKNYLANVANDDDFIMSGQANILYLPLKKATKYIKNTTGIKVPTGELLRLASNGDVDLYLNGVNLRQKDFSKLSVRENWLYKVIFGDNPPSSILMETYILNVICGKSFSIDSSHHYKIKHISLIDDKHIHFLSVIDDCHAPNYLENRLGSFGYSEVRYFDNKVIEISGSEAGEYIANAIPKVKHLAVECCILTPSSDDDICYFSDGKREFLSSECVENLYISTKDIKLILERIFGYHTNLENKKIVKPTMTQETNESVTTQNESPLGEKERTNLHRVIHAMKEVLLAENNKEDRLFKSQNELIAHLVSTYKGYSGLSESQLKQLCAKLNQQFDEAEKTFKNSL